MRGMLRRLTAVLTLVTALAAAAAAAVGAVTAAAAPTPAKHVWVIQLENKSYDDSFVKNMANMYLWRTLPQAGLLMRQYHGTGHASLDNYITQLSGQAPNPITQADCPIYQDVLPGIIGTDGQALGAGCIYPPQVKTLVDQLEAKGLSWKGYMEDMGNDPAREPATCGNPVMNKQDPTQGAAANDQYAARHNPFVYFHSILDVPGRCQSHVVTLPPLADDLKSVATTPNFSWITPNLCNDGHDATPCKGKNTKGTNEGDLIAADAFLAKWVPTIMRSKAFQQDGLLFITFDESSISDAASCCAEPAGLNTPMPGIFGPGGGRTGAILLSPYVKAGSTTDTPYNHYSFLKSLEQVFGIDQYLGYANLPGLQPFGGDVYGRPAGGPVPLPGQLAPGDAGSTGKAVPLRVRLTVSPRPRTLPGLRAGFKRGLRVGVRVTGSDRGVSPVGVRVVRRGRGGVFTPVATSGRLRLLKDGRGTFVLRLTTSARRRLSRGTYVVLVEAFHENKVQRRARVTVRVR
jgi:hypothetical protein